MNEVLQSKLAEIVELGKNGILQAADMIKEQMPDLVEQILRYNFVVSLLSWLTAIACFILVYKCVQRILKVMKYENERNVSNGYCYYAGKSIATNIICTVLGVICLITGLVLFFEHAAWIKISIAPKLYLVEYLSYLIK